MKTPTVPYEWEFHLGDQIDGPADPAKLLRTPENRFLAPLVRPGMDILEAGAGNGRYVFAFAASGARATGLDFAPALVERVRAEAKRLRLDNNVEAVSGDILNLPFEHNSFDLYTSFGVYEHFTRTQHRRLFQEAFRVLRPGGIIYLEVPHFWSAWTLRRELRYWFRRLFPPPLVWQRNMRRRYVVARAEEAGFQTVQSRVFNAWYGFQKGFSIDISWLKGVPNPFCALKPLFEAAAAYCEPRQWLGHTLIYIGKKPSQSR